MNRHAASVTLAMVALLASSARPASAQVTVEAEIATAIVERMPEGVGSEFPADVGDLYCWSHVVGAEDSTISHVWIYRESEFVVPLTIGGSPWRTWSSKVIPPEWTGEWRVEIRDSGGDVLEELVFTVG